MFHIYDIEITPYSFIYGEYDEEKELFIQFVISSYRNDIDKLRKHLKYLIDNKRVQVGFNNLDYDYPLIHYLIDIITKIDNVDLLLEKLNEKNKQLIPDNKVKKGNKFGRSYNVIHNPHIIQIDLYKIHHFDNASKKTSLFLA